MKTHLLLLSNSILHGQGYLDFAESLIKQTLGPQPKTIFFVPYASHDHDGYASFVTKRFLTMGYRVVSAHHSKDKAQAIEAADAVFVGGGNTFRLLRDLYANNLITLIQQHVKKASSTSEQVLAQT